jgi:hypothetical protein
MCPDDRASQERDFPSEDVSAIVTCGETRWLDRHEWPGTLAATLLRRL